MNHALPLPVRCLVAVAIGAVAAARVGKWYVRGASYHHLATGQKVALWIVRSVVFSLVGFLAFAFFYDMNGLGTKTLVVYVLGGFVFGVIGFALWLFWLLCRALKLPPLVFVAGAVIGGLMLISKIPLSGGRIVIGPFAPPSFHK